MRWHAERNLPVHRVPGGQRGSIFAFATELDAWLSSHAGVQGNLAPVLVHRGNPSPSYERAKQLWEMRSEDNLNEVIESYRSALQQDCVHAGAYAGLACALLASSALDLIEGSIALMQARMAVAKALALDPQHPEAICAQGWIAFWGLHDPAAAARCFQQLFAADPNHDFGISGQAWLHTLLGEREQAVAAAANLLRQTAFSTYSALVACRIYFLNGEFRRSLHVAAQSIASRNAGPMIRIFEALAFYKIGESEKAIRTLQRQAAVFEHAAIIGSLSYLYGMAGRYERATSSYRLLLNMSERQEPGCSYPLAVASLGLGRHQRAIEWLERSCKEESFHALTLHIDPIFQSLHGNAGFEQLLRRYRQPSGVPTVSIS
jgi:tetratricopeptide (TPR) repeat protein